MFKNPRYTTKGINENLPIMTQIFLWGLIETMEVPEQDPSLNTLLQSEALALSLAETAGGTGSEDG